MRREKYKKQFTYLHTRHTRHTRHINECRTLEYHHTFFDEQTPQTAQTQHSTTQHNSGHSHNSILQSLNNGK